MSVNSKDVFVGSPDQVTTPVTAHILTGPETNVIPAQIDAFVYTGLNPAGFVNEDGVTITPSDSTETIKDWSLAAIRRVLTEFEATLAWTHIDLSAASLKNYVGDANVTTVAANATHGTQLRAALGAALLPTKAWYFRIKDGARRVVVFVPHGQITERGEVPITGSAAVVLPVTLSTYPDSAGNNIYIYTDDGVLAA